jgi:hypothetical protein
MGSTSDLKNSKSKISSEGTEAVSFDGPEFADRGARAAFSE